MKIKEHISAQKGTVILGLLVILVIAFAVLARPFLPSRTQDQGATLDQTDAQQTAPLAFVDNQTCAGCHAEQVEDWLGSHHEQAMQVANRQTVLGDFDDATFTESDVTSRFFQKDGRFFVNTEGPDGNYADFEVKYTFGISPLQQYLLEFPNGRLQAFTVAWDTVEERWFTLYPDEDIEPDDPVHWTGRFFTANSSCIECHTTNMALNYDLSTDTYHTSWDEINVSCQACHGPGEDHVKWAQENGNDANKGLVVDYSSLEAQDVVENCARCHSRRYSVSKNDTSGHPFFDDFMPELLREGLYHADGQILDEVYVYGSFTQSKMYHEGVSCIDCHNPHTLELRQEGNQLCAGCHQLNPPSQKFETLSSKNYDTPEHHFHEVDSTGAQCVNCHMPAETYMIIDPRRDHQFSIPRPDVSVEWETPNACTDCHSDQSAEWAVESMDKWYGPQWQERPSIAGIMTMARAGDPVAEVPLFEVINDINQPAIVRATALELVGQYGAKGMAIMAGALSDDSPLVRATALQGFEELQNSQKLQLVEALLSDPVRGVRIEAAKALSTLSRNEFDEAQWQTFEAALEEYKAAQLAQADHPEGHLNLASLYAVMGQLDLAEQSYQTAIDRDNHFLPAHDNLANFYYQTGRSEEAEKTFRDALELMPEQGSLYYSLGLLLVEQQRLDEAATNLAKAAELMPNQQRLHYNYGLLLQELGQMSQAEEALLHAYDLSPSDQDILVALITFYREQGQPQEALTYAEQLNQLHPNVPPIMELLDSIQQEILRQ